MRTPHPIAFIVGILGVTLGVLALARGNELNGIVLLAFTTVALTLGSLRLNVPPKELVKTRELYGLCATAVVFGAVMVVLGVLALGDSNMQVGGVIAFALALCGIGLAYFFGALARTAAQSSSLLSSSENGLARAIGRERSSFRGLVVIATESKLVAARATLIGRAVPAVLMPYAEITSFQAEVDAFTAESDEQVIAMVKCPPSLVHDLQSVVNSNIRSEAVR